MLRVSHFPKVTSSSYNGYGFVGKYILFKFLISQHIDKLKSSAKDSTLGKFSVPSRFILDSQLSQWFVISIAIFPAH